MTCKAIERFALNTPETLKLVNDHEIVTLRADFTDGAPEIAEWLKKYDSISIPLTVILPAGRPDEPIVLRDVYTQSTLLEKLQEAVTPATNPEAQASRPKPVPK